MFIGIGTYTGTGRGRTTTLGTKLSSYNKEKYRNIKAGCNSEKMLHYVCSHVMSCREMLPVCASVSTVCGVQETPLLWTNGVQSMDLFFSSLGTVWTLAWRTDNSHRSAYTVCLQLSCSYESRVWWGGLTCPTTFVWVSETETVEEWQSQKNKQTNKQTS